MNASYGVAVIAGTIAVISLGSLAYSMITRQRPSLPAPATIEAQAVAPSKGDRAPIRIIPLPVRPIQVERIAPFFEPPAPQPEAPKVSPPKSQDRVVTKEEPSELEPDPNPSRRHWHWHEPKLRHRNVLRDDDSPRERSDVCAKHGLKKITTGRGWRCR